MMFNIGFLAHMVGKPKTFTIPAPKAEGDWNERGRWVPATPPEPITVTATILPMTSKDLQYYEAGTYTTEDVKVIVDGSVKLPIGTRFEHDGATFEVREARDYAEVANLRRYVAKRLREGETP